MNVLSLFDGISAGRIALDRAGFHVENYYRSEIDKYANQVSKNNFPNSIDLGDVTKWRDWDIDWSSIDLLIGGSPCQGFSFAGKQLAFDDPRSKLFFEFCEILRHIYIYNPSVKFLLENVKMKKEYLNVISDLLGVEPILINSSLVSAQNRQRYYWFNWIVQQPLDKGIVLNDILEVDVDKKFYLSNEAIDYMSRLRNGKPRWEYHKNPQFGKSACLTANMYKGVPYGVLRLNKNLVCGAIRGRYELVNGKQKIIQKLEIRKDKKTNTLTTVQKDNVVVWRPASILGRRLNKSGVRNDYDKSIKVTQCLEVRHSLEKMHCLTTVQKDTLLSLNAPMRYENAYNRYDLICRKLTPIECERLQTFPDNYTACVSNTQRYKALGNSWTVDVISHIFKAIK